MKENNLSMYGSTVGFKQYSGIVEQVALGQVIRWSQMPNSMIGIGIKQEFVNEIARKSGMTLDQYMEFFSGKHTRIELAQQSTQLKEIEDGVGGARVMLSIKGTLFDPRDKKTFWRRRLNCFQFNSDLVVKVRDPKSKSDSFLEESYTGRVVISGPDYALNGIKEFLDETKSEMYQLNLVSKAQHMAFISKC